MKSPLYIWCTYDGETLYEESSVYMVYIRWGDLGETLYEEFSVYMVYILWGDLV